MGYRTYIGFIPKREYNKIKSLTEAEFIKYRKVNVDEDGDWYEGPYSITEELYQFGKYTDFQPPKGSKHTFFKKSDMKSRYKYYDFHVVNKQFLAYIIDHYKEKIKKYYNDMITPFLLSPEANSWEVNDFIKSVKTEYGYPDDAYVFDFSKITPTEQTAIYKIWEHVRSMRSEWVDLQNIDLDNGSSVTRSWKYEYSIFELVRIYKSFDWSRNVMVYYGY